MHYIILSLGVFKYLLLHGQERERRDVDRFVAMSDPSWLTQLNMDPQTEAYRPNKSSRQVFSGHYVLVEPE